MLDVIIDTDPGCDDAIAILQALLSPHLHVRAILLVHGNTTLKNTVKNLTSILRLSRLEYQRRSMPWKPIRVAIGSLSFQGLDDIYVFRI